MRSVVMLLIGLVVGALCSITLLRALSEGNEYPKGVMALMGKHFGALREVADAGQCEAATVAHHAATLRQVALDLEPAFLPTGGDDAAFRAYSERLRHRVAAIGAAVGQ